MQNTMQKNWASQTASVLVRALALVSLLAASAFNVVLLVGPSIFVSRFRLIVSPPNWVFVLWPIINLGTLINLLCLVYRNTQGPQYYHWSIALNCLNILSASLLYINTQTSLLLCFFAVVIWTYFFYKFWELIYNPFRQSLVDLISKNLFSLQFGWLLAHCFWLLGVVMVFQLGMSQHSYSYVFFLGLVFSYVVVSVNVWQRQRDDELKGWIGSLFGLCWALIGAMIGVAMWRDKF